MSEKTINKVVKEYFREDLDSFNVDELYAGIDEVGVSSIAGRFVCSVVILPKNHEIPRLPIDSKKLSEKNITELALEIERKALYYAIIAIDPNDVDEMVSKYGMLTLQKKCWTKAVKLVREHFPNVPIILDGRHKIKGQGKYYKNMQSIVRADDLYDSVSAAAIISKHWCDEDLKREGEKYPEYRWKKNKGYPTSEHFEIIQKHGLTPFHRKYMAEQVVMEKTKTYTVEEMEPVLRKAGTYLGEDITLVNERVVPFLRQMWVMVIKQKQLPTEKQQRYLMRACEEVIKNHNRKAKRQAG